MTLPRSTEGAWLFFAIAKDIAPRDIAKVRLVLATFAHRMQFSA
jgi:hypothetical protein